MSVAYYFGGDPPVHQPAYLYGGAPVLYAGGLIFGGLPRPRRRYVVEKGREVLVFATEEAARLAQEAIDKARAIRETAATSQAPNRRRAKAKAARRAATTIAQALAIAPPLDAFTLEQAQTIAADFDQSETLRHLAQLRDLEAIAALWHHLRDEEDVAALLELI